jgi:hypothetical protein
MRGYDGVIELHSHDKILHVLNSSLQRTLRAKRDPVSRCALTTLQIRPSTCDNDQHPLLITLEQRLRRPVLVACPERTPCRIRDAGARRAKGQVCWPATDTSKLDALISTDYPHGFFTKLSTDTLPRGLDGTAIRLISAKKEGPDFMLDWRLKFCRHWLTISEPRWPTIHRSPILSRMRPPPRVSAPIDCSIARAAAGCHLLRGSATEWRRR